jgi:hypothetical protein
MVCNFVDSKVCNFLLTNLLVLVCDISREKKNHGACPHGSVGGGVGRGLGVRHHTESVTLSTAQHLGCLCLCPPPPRLFQCHCTVAWGMHTLLCAHCPAVQVCALPLTLEHLHHFASASHQA